MTFFTTPEPPDRTQPERGGGTIRGSVHAIALFGMIVLPFMLIVGSLLTAFRKWGSSLSDEQLAAIDQQAFLPMIAAGVIMAVSALAVIVLRLRLRERFVGGTIWAVLAVPALPLGCWIVLVGAANL